MKFERGAVFKVNNGEKTKFWENIWIKDTKLKEVFPRLYNCCRDKDAMVCDCWDGEEWSINFRRSFGEEEVKEWEALLKELNRYQMGEEGTKCTGSLKNLDCI